ncbi:MAG: hypothetical protein JWO86_6280 [Myxococcaceae bacterium]|nr:hypothetical protein [Myxococcaceae bacterium]
MISRAHSTAALLLVSASLTLVACSGSTDTSVAGDDPELKAASSLAAGDFATTEQAGGQLSPIGCRHYIELHVGGGKSPQATLEPRLDSADKSEIEADGSCGGEELPKNENSVYPLKFVSKNDCGANVFEGTIKWTTTGKVTRTLRLTDHRVGTCKTKPALLVAELTSTYMGQTNAIATYFSVDPR